VATADQHASLAGIRMLMKGGNAVDAIVASAAALNVVEPFMSGIGGFGGFMLIYMANEGRVRALDMMGMSPKAASSRNMTEQDFDEGYKSPLVPGNLKGWAAALERYGTMSLGDVFEPAIDLAEGGFPISDFDASAISGSAAKLAKFPTAARIFLPGGKAPKVGWILKQPDLARTFRRIALDGSDAFYMGEIGDRIVSFLQQHGGLLTRNELAAFTVRWREPIETNYLGHTLYTMPPGSCGMTMFQTLNIMEGFEPRAMDPYGADFAHYWIEAVKLALNDDDRLNTGRDVDIPVERVISKQYAAEQRKKIQASRVSEFAGPLLPSLGTTHLAAADRSGNVVTFTQSLMSGFGCGVVAGNTGVLLNNGHRLGFVLDPSHVNRLEGGAHAKGLMSPTMVFRDGRILMALGAAGGYTIPQTIGQVITKVLAYGLDIQHAISSPRMAVNRSGSAPAQPLAGGGVPVGKDAQTYLEAGFSEATLARLKDLGHRLSPPGNLGGVQGVYIDPESSALIGGSDPRRDGHPIAW
jgi:gamma-glutamyltranspeptidase/glutathione hydrolase